MMSAARRRPRTLIAPCLQGDRRDVRRQAFCSECRERCASATAIAAVQPDTLWPLLRELDGDDVDAIVQVGTNLSMLGLAAEAERELGTPVVAINAATLWQALRENDFDDQFESFGVLLREH